MLRSDTMYSSYLLVFCGLFLFASCESNVTEPIKLSKDIVDLMQVPPDSEQFMDNITTTSEKPQVATKVTISENFTFAYNMTEPPSEEFYDFKVNYSVPWNIFIALLMQESFDQLKNIQHNIKSNYQLGDIEKKEIDNVFNKSEEDFENLIMKKHNSMKKEAKTNSTHDFMLEFADASNGFLEKIVGYNLGLVKGKLDSPTSWFQQSLRHKILRQQSKNSSNHIQFRLCKVLSVCKEKKRYSHYVVEWIRHLLALDKEDLKEFYVVVPKVLKTHSNFVRSNLKFRQTLKYIIKSHEMVQRDTLDFLDEVITKRTKIYKMVPEALRHGARALTQLFTLLDKYYDLDTDNCEELDDISEILSMWKYQEINVSYVLESIIDNMKMNVEGWPSTAVQKLENIWYQITVL